MKVAPISIHSEKSLNSKNTANSNILLLKTILMMMSPKKDFNRAINDLLSAGIYLADDIIIDCSSLTDEKEKKSLNLLI